MLGLNPIDLWDDDDTGDLQISNEDPFDDDDDELGEDSEADGFHFDDDLEEDEYDDTWPDEDEDGLPAYPIDDTYDHPYDYPGSDGEG